VLNTTVSLIVYFFEMLIAYIVFSFAGERRRSMFITFLLGLVIYESAAVVNLVFNNTIWINFIYVFFTNYLFVRSCFAVSRRKAIVFTVLINIISITIEFATIFAVSALAGAGITDYNTNFSLLLMEAAISKTLSLIACLALVHAPHNGAAIDKIPNSFYFFALCILFSLISFWHISTHESLSDTNQLLLSVISLVLLGATAFLLITYRRRMEIDNEHIRMKSEFDRLQTEKAYYDILERQNQQLMIYAHDTKKHLAAIQNLSTDPDINDYIEKLSAQLRNYTDNCHSGNKILDVIINKYATECDLRGVAFDFDVRSCNLNQVEDIDLVSILGNLLDNALTAAEGSEQKYISLETTTRNSYCVVIISNSCDREPASHEAHLITTKEDKRLHGFGIKSVRKTLKKYQGDYNWDYDAGRHRFIATVMLSGIRKAQRENLQ